MSEDDEMEENKITLNIDGPKVLASKLISGMQAFYDLISHVTDSVLQKKNSVQWVASVRSGSNLLDLMPLPAKNIDESTFEGIANALNNGIELLEGGPDERPPYFNDDALEAAKTLARMIDVKTGAINKVGICISGAVKNLSSQSAATVDKILGGKYEAIGSVEGKLEMISQRNEFHCHVWDALNDRKVRCHIDIEKPDMRKKVIDAFGKRVAVYGRIRYRKDGTAESITVSDIKVFRDPNDLPSLDQVQGLFKNR